jgi:hypothetical protein
MKELGEKKRARALMLRLTDREIELFAKGENLIAYADSQRSLRWKLIRLAYLSEKEVNDG